MCGFFFLLFLKLIMVVVLPTSLPDFLFNFIEPAFPQMGYRLLAESRRGERSVNGDFLKVRKEV